MLLITCIFSQKVKHIFMYSMKLNFLLSSSKGLHCSLYLIFLFFCISSHYLSFLISVYFAAHLSLLSLTVKIKQLSFHFRLVVAEG